MVVGRSILESLPIDPFRMTAKQTLIDAALPPLSLYSFEIHIQIQNVIKIQIRIQNPNANPNPISLSLSLHASHPTPCI